MTKTDQKRIVRELTSSIRDGVLAQIQAGKIPKHWDGHELRQLLAYRHKSSADMCAAFKDGRSRRSKEFWNHVIVENL